MPRQPRALAASGVYHVMMRGVNRDVIFLTNDAYQRFLQALKRAKDASGCQVLAYSLMSNHVHLLINAADKPPGDLMKRVGVSYAGWFNKTYDHVGHVFQDRFLSLPVETDEYLLAVVRYIWNNPVEAKLVENPTDYRWNSCWSGGAPAQLVDDDELDALMPRLSRHELVKPISRISFERTGTGGPAPRHADHEVADLLRLQGVDDARRFNLLEPQTQRRIIRELRMRSVAYHMIAAATGLSYSTVRRLSIGAVVDP